VNPNLGVSIQKEFLTAECKKARLKPSYENTFKRLYLNIRTEQIARWLQMEAWDSCAGPASHDPIRWRADMLEALKGQSCFAGLDLGSTSDLTALCLLFPKPTVPERLWPATAENVFIPFFWVPEVGARRKDAMHQALYQTWIQQGFIRRTEGDVTDYDVVRADINRLATGYGILVIGVDRVFQGAQLCTQLMADGLNVLAFGQGFLSMAAPTKAFEEDILNGRILHGANPVLRWMAANAQVKSDEAGNIKPIKPDRSSPLKIDGLVASIMSLGIYMAPPKDLAGPSVYENRGMLML
jgi:phage terminase large subunit-like protein